MLFIVALVMNEKFFVLYVQFENTLNFKARYEKEIAFTIENETK